MTNECGSHEKVNFNHISAANFNCSHIFQSSGAFFRLDRQLPRLQKAVSLRRFAYGCVIKSQPTKSKLPSRRQVTSRWKAVLSEYNNIRVQCLNSEALSERTGLTLFHIIETTVIKWYKDTSRVSEVRTLLQGLKLPTVQPCTAEKLPEVNTQPKEPPEPPPTTLRIYPQRWRTPLEKQGYGELYLLRFLLLPRLAHQLHPKPLPRRLM